MNRMDYVQGVVRTRILEKKLISNVKFEQMMEAENIKEVWGILKTTAYAHHLSDHITVDQYENVLEQELQKVYTEMREIAKHPEIIDILALKYDYHNLKVLIKEVILQTDLSHLYISIGSFDIEKIKTAIQHEKHNELEAHLKTAIEEVQKQYDETEDPQQIEIILDKFFMNDLYNRVTSVQIPLLLEYVKAMIDFLNIRTVIRLQKQKKDIVFLKDVLLENGNIERDDIVYSLHDSIRKISHKFRNEKISGSLIRGLEAYENTNQLTDFEKEMDNYLFRMIQEAKYIHFGPEPLIAYIIAKETEIKNLRMIFISKRNNISLEQIKKRVRDIDG